MRIRKLTLGFLPLLLLLLFLLPPPARAMTPGQGKEFDRILHLRLADLTEEAARLLQKKYPDEDWEAYRFPAFVYASKAVDVGYKIAVKEPTLLKLQPCFCFCDTMGHRSLLYCFWKDGKAGGQFDEHASECNICYGEAMLALLWQNAGATPADIQQGFNRKFELLIKKHQKGK